VCEKNLPKNYFSGKTPRIGRLAQFLGALLPDAIKNALKTVID